MRLVLILTIILLALAVGLGLTRFATGPGARYLVQDVEGWEFSPRIGAPEIDPYARARLFSDGELPLAAGEGYALRRRNDADGIRLDSHCRYRLSSPFPSARYWTATLSDRTGYLVKNLAERSSFTSAEIVRSHDGTFTIEIGPDPLVGNWLPTRRTDGPFELILRFYETPLSATATQFDPRSIPTLRRLACPE